MFAAVTVRVAMLPPRGAEAVEAAHWGSVCGGATDGRPRTRCQVLAHLDPHIDYVPGFLITFVMKAHIPTLHAPHRSSHTPHYLSRPTVGSKPHRAHVSDPQCLHCHRNALKVGQQSLFRRAAH